MLPQTPSPTALFPSPFSPFSVQLPKERGGVALGKLLNVCDLNFSTCKMGRIAVLQFEMKWYLESVSNRASHIASSPQRAPVSFTPSLASSASVRGRGNVCLRIWDVTFLQCLLTSSRLRPSAQNPGWPSRHPLSVACGMWIAVLSVPAAT